MKWLLLNEMCWDIVIRSIDVVTGRLLRRMQMAVLHAEML